MKKNISAVLAALLLVSLCACGRGSGNATHSLEIVTTIFPVYDWARQVTGDESDVGITMLLDSGVDLHSYQPTAQDILKIAGCDLFIYEGGESDAWVKDALAEATNKNMIVLNLMEELGELAKEEELTEGMEAHDQEHDEEETEYDEHIWLSLRNAAFLTDRIAAALAKLDPTHEAAYRAHAEAYGNKLKELDQRYVQAVAEGKVHTLLFGDRFPFRYLTDDYGLGYYAAFSGCSAETEASFETVTFLAAKVDELGLEAVMTIEGTDHRIAQTIVQNTRTKDQRILTLDSLQSVTARDVQNGATYLSIMEKNLEVLREALSRQG